MDYAVKNGKNLPISMVFEIYDRNVWTVG